MTTDRAARPATLPSALSIRTIFQTSSKLSLANVAGGALAALANILAARRLGPEGMGVFGLCQLWMLYASLSRPGLLQAAYREILHLQGQGQTAASQRVSDAAVTAEGAWLALTSAVMAALAGALVAEPRTRVCLMLTSAVFFCNSLFQFADSLQWAHRRFRSVTRANVLTKFSQPLLMLLGLYSFGLYGIVAAPAFSALIVLGFYIRQADGPAWRPAWDGPELRRLLWIGLPLAAQGALYWAFRTSDRAMTAAWLTLAELGYFSFVMLFVNHACQWISDFLNVLQASVFAELGRLGEIRPLAPKLQRISLLIILLTAAGAGLAQTLFHPLVSVFAPRFLPGTAPCEILMLNLIAITAPLLATTVLTSAVLNRQNSCALLQAAGLGLNILGGWWLVRRGWGLAGIAWASTLAQLGVAAAAQALLHPHLFRGAPPEEAPRFYAWWAGLVLLAGAFYGAARLPWLSYGLSGPLLAPLGLRLAVCSALWAAAAWALHRSWWRSAPTAAAGPAAFPSAGKLDTMDQ